MKMLLALLPTLFAASCTTIKHEATNGQKHEVDIVMQWWGGASDVHGADGFGATSDNDKAWSNTMQAAGVIGGSVAQVATQKAKELTTRSIDANATSAAIAKTKADAASTAAKAAAQADTTKAAIGAGAPLGTVNVNPP